MWDITSWEIMLKREILFWRIAEWRDQIANIFADTKALSRHQFEINRLGMFNPNWSKVIQKHEISLVAKMCSAGILFKYRYPIEGIHSWKKYQNKAWSKPFRNRVSLVVRDLVLPKVSFFLQNFKNGLQRDRLKGHVSVISHSDRLSHRLTLRYTSNLRTWHNFSYFYTSSSSHLIFILVSGLSLEYPKILFFFFFSSLLLILCLLEICLNHYLHRRKCLRPYVKLTLYHFTLLHLLV